MSDGKAKRLKTIIETLNLKKKNFAESIGLSASGLSMITTGKNNLTQSLSLAIEGVHGYNHKWIMDGVGEPKIASQNTAYHFHFSLWENYTDEDNKEALDVLINAIEYNNYNALLLKGLDLIKFLKQIRDVNTMALTFIKLIKS